MNAQQRTDTASELTAGDQGPLAVDESNPTCNKRFAALKIPQTVDILASRPGWNLFRDGCPSGEMPAQISARVDRLIHRLTKLDGNVALVSHSHLGRVVAARWIGLSVEHAQHFLLNTASLSVLCCEHDRPDEPAIALWNSPPLETFATVFNRDAGSVALNEPSIDRWENEGGEITLPLQNAGKITL